MIESYTFNPPEFAPGRTPLSFHELGLEVGPEGADWGESQVVAQLARQQVGATVTDRRLEPVEMSIPLIVMEDSDVSLADAAYRLQQAVGLMQADEYEPNWLMREFSDRVGAAGAVGYLIHSAALHGLQGRGMAYSGIAPEVTLKLLRSPYCYAAEEVEGSVFSAEGARSLEWCIGGNLIPNPSPVFGLNHIEKILVKATLNDFSAVPFEGDHYVHLKATATSSGAVAVIHFQGRGPKHIPVIPGREYTLTGRNAAVLNPTAGARFFMNWLDAEGKLISQSAGASVTGSEAQPELVATAPPNAVGVQCLFGAELANAEVLEVYITGVSLTDGATVLGTGPGLFRLRVTNNGEEDWRGLIVPVESRDHPQDETAQTTAALSYEAEDLTLSGGAEVKERAGASGGKVVRANLTAGWITILSSEIDGVGHMTHVGVRRLLARIYDPGEAGSVELRAEFRSLGAVRWSETQRTVPSPLADDFALVDLGEMRPERAVLGDQRWEWRILSRAPSGSGTIDIDQVRPEPVEQRAVVRVPVSTQAADQQSQKPPGTVENDASQGGNPWSNVSNAKASDNSYATQTKEGLGAGTQIMKATNLGFGIPEGATISGIIVEVERKASGESWPNVVQDSMVGLYKAGVLKKITNFDFVAGVGGSLVWPAAEHTKIFGSSTHQWFQTWTPADINAANFGFGMANWVQSATASVDQIRIVVYFTKAADENRACFAGRSIEFRSECVARQHPVDDVWGEVINEGFNLVAAPSYLEGRNMRGLVLPSVGDLDVLPDSGSHDIEAQVLYRPGYHYSREVLEA